MADEAPAVKAPKAAKAVDPKTVDVAEAASVSAGVELGTEAGSVSLSNGSVVRTF